MAKHKARNQKKKKKKKKRQKRSKHSALDGYVSDQVHAVHGPSANLDAAGVAAWNIFCYNSAGFFS